MLVKAFPTLPQLNRQHAPHRRYGNNGDPKRMAEEIEWWDFDAAEDLIDAVVGDVSFIIESALDARGQALVAFPGGSTPKPILEKLAQANIRWKNVTIVPTDDRLVPVDNPLSNVAMIAKIFIPKGARVLPITSDAADYKLAGSAANARLADLHWPPDLVWLGMGTDGHTASIFRTRFGNCNGRRQRCACRRGCTRSITCRSTRKSRDLNRVGHKHCAHRYSCD